MQWRTNTAACLTLQAYRFSYDKGNRLLAADHWTNPGTWANTANYSESNITYDLNGNIKTYNRRGLTAPGTFGFIDLMSYSYNTSKPDQLTLVGDGASSTKGFKRGYAGTDPYSYDANGNLIFDKNKGIVTPITYNHLNLPTNFTLGANVITMTYTADGEKLTKVAATTKNYVSGIEYTGANLEAIYTSEGRCTPNGASFFYEYSIKDHLGNTRVSFRANGAALTPIQENHYYPFGMEIEGLSTLAQVGTENAYQYNGKELNEDFGLNLSDYGARWCDLTLGRWWAADPLMEWQPNLSGYNYVNNNPIGRIDPTGMNDIGADGLTNDEWLNQSRPDGGVWAANNKNLEKTPVWADNNINVEDSESKRHNVSKKKDYKRTSVAKTVISGGAAGLGHYAPTVDYEISLEDGPGDPPYPTCCGDKNDMYVDRVMGTYDAMGKEGYEIYKGTFEKITDPAVDAALFIFGAELLFLRPTAVPAAIAAKSAPKFIIRFGNDANQIHHVWRHVDDLGLDTALVQPLAESEVLKAAPTMVKGALKECFITVNGIRLQLNAFLLDNGLINIGRINAVK